MNKTVGSDEVFNAEKLVEPPDLVIKGGTVITMAEDKGVIHDATIFIRNGRIMDIREKEEGDLSGLAPSQMIDAENAVIMPGLVNAHTHIPMTLFRGYADDLPLREWLFERIFPAEAQFLNPETVYWGALLGCLESIASGTTCIADGYFFQDSTIQAVHESGLRGLISQGVIDFPAPGVKDPEQNLKVAAQFIEKWLSFSALITPGMFCHSPSTCSAHTLIRGFEISKSYQVPLQIHLSENRQEVEEILKKTGQRPVHYLDQLGLVSEDLVAAHAVHLNEGEMDCLREKGAKIVHLPESNMKLASGVSRAAEMIKKGLVVGIGTDGSASNNNLDLFGEMDTATKLSKAVSGDPTSLDAKTVLRMATSQGAAVLGLEKQIGTIQEGKKADIIVVDTNRPHMCPIYDPLSAMVYSAEGSDVRDVIVNGRILMRNREFQTLDAESIMDRVRKISTKIKGVN